MSLVDGSCWLLLLLGHFAVASTKHLSNANNSSIFSVAKCSQLVAVVVVNAKREKIATTTATATPAAATVKYNNTNNNNNSSSRKNINLAGIFLAFLCPASGPTDL